MRRSLVWSLAVSSIAAADLTAQRMPDGRAVVEEVNLARTNPSEYARYIERLLQYFDGRILRIPGEIGLRTEEGAAAVREAVAYLRRADPLPPLEHVPALTAAARDHVRDQGPRGAFGHEGSDGSTTSDRISRYARWRQAINENIDYGAKTARDVVISLIVDDGVSSRGHRRNIFDIDARYVGVACGPHTVYDVMCVMDFAAGLEVQRARYRKRG